MSNVDLALALETLLPGAQYGGSLTPNTPEAYGAIIWDDKRPKPGIEELLAVVVPEKKEAILAKAHALFTSLPLELQEAYQTPVNNFLIASQNGNEPLALRNLKAIQPLEPAHAPILAQFASLFGLDIVAPVDSTVGPVDAGLDALLDAQAGTPFSG
ncbi:MAG: hypothetical protein QE263_04655 [Vampirovibrionales bacterium]|nr:hypothetical protein [Vampirovibrionales bacterium]